MIAPVVIVIFVAIVDCARFDGASACEGLCSATDMVADAGGGGIEAPTPELPKGNFRAAVATPPGPGLPPKVAREFTEASLDVEVG